MKRRLRILTLACALSGAATFAETSTSENYSVSTSIDFGGQRVTSADYQQNVYISSVSGHSVSTFGVAMDLGFPTQITSGPVAADDIHSHPLNLSVNITASSLLANDIDPDGGTLTIIAVDPLSAHGGNLLLNGQTISYTPPAGLNDYDTFKYTVADGGGNTDIATVLLAIAPLSNGQAVNSVAMIPQPDGKYLIRFRQQTGFSDYIIQITHDLNTPWENLEDAHVGADGVVETLVPFDPTQNTFFRAVVY